MITEKEIEFKTEINENEYQRLINKYNLKDSIYEITNYYFDTPYHTFKKSYKTLRIRYKENKDSYVLTLKSKVAKGIIEKHYNLDANTALRFINGGINLKDYFDIDTFVTCFGGLQTKRVTMPYKGGVLFFDKFSYFDITKYEIEYEVKDYDKGLLDFKDFLNDEKINFTKTPKKSTRFFTYINNKK